MPGAEANVPQQSLRETSTLRPVTHEWMHSTCRGRIWTHTPSCQQTSWAKWCRSCRTTSAAELIAPGWPNMPWFWDLVTISSQILLCLPNLLIQPDPTQEFVKSEPACLAPRASAIKEQGFSEAVAARIEAPQRGSTRSVYEAKWAIFTKWCLSNQVDFRAPSLKAIADFYTCFKTGSYSSIDVYRSAFADKLGNSPFRSAKMRLSLVSRIAPDSFHRHIPKGQRGIPSCNLSLVLH